MWAWFQRWYRYKWRGRGLKGGPTDEQGLSRHQIVYIIVCYSIVNEAGQLREDLNCCQPFLLITFECLKQRFVSKMGSQCQCFLLKAVFHRSCHRFSDGSWYRFWFRCCFYPGGASPYQQSCCYPDLIPSLSKLPPSHPAFQSGNSWLKTCEPLKEGGRWRGKTRGRDGDREGIRRGKVEWRGEAKGHGSKERKKNREGRDERRGGANNYRSSHVFKALLLSPVPVSERERESGKREDEKRKTGVQAALVQITQQPSTSHGLSHALTNL